MLTRSLSGIALIATVSACTSCSKDQSSEPKDATSVGDGDDSTSGGTSTGGPSGTDGEPGGTSTGGPTGTDGEPGGTSTGGTTTGTSGDGPTTRPPLRSTGCGEAAGFNGQKSFQVSMPGPGGNQVEREFHVMAPESADYDADTPLPVVFIFHGANGTGSFEWALERAANGEAGKNAIFVAPQGILLPGYEDYGLGWNEDCDGYDMPFFDAMLAQVASDFCIDRELVFAVGFSWGGDMSNSLGCCRGDVVRGVVPTSSGERNTGYDGACTEETSAFMMSYSDNDQAYTQEAFRSIIDFYKGSQGCEDGTVDGPAPAVSTEGATGSCKSYVGCDAPVIECLYPGMGHAKPELWREDIWTFVKSFQQ